MGQVVDKDSMDGPEQERVDCPLEGLKSNGRHVGVLWIFEEILDQFAIVDEEPQEASDTEDNEEEEKEYDGYICHFVAEVEAEEGLALVEEVEGKLFDVALVDDEEEHSWEWVFPQVLWQSVVEEDLEDHHQDEVDGDCERQLEEEKVKIVGEEPNSIVVSLKVEGIGVVFLVIEWFHQVLIESNILLADVSLAFHEKILHELSLLIGHLVDVVEKDFWFLSEVVVVLDDGRWESWLDDEVWPEGVEGGVDGLTCYQGDQESA